MKTLALPEASPQPLLAQSPIETAAFHEFTVPPDGENHRLACRLLSAQAGAAGATLLGGQIFGRPLRRPQGAFGIVPLAGLSSPPRRIFGIRGLAVRAPKLESVVLRGRRIGWRFEDASAAYGFFPGLIPPLRVRSTPKTQAASWFQNINAVLACADFSFADVVRTWFYLDRILDWYGDFNAVRTAYFHSQGLYGKFVPASTGIGAANASGTAITGDVFCVRPKNRKVRVLAVPSPLQCPALNYRSVFSRAVEIQFPDRRWLMISGTASIDPQGESMHRFDPDAQVALTMNVLHAILRSRGMTWNSVWRGIVYLRWPAMAEAYDRWIHWNHPEGLPLTRAVCEICREELLFEIELDAVAAGRKAAPRKR